MSLLLFPALVWAVETDTVYIKDFGLLPGAGTDAVKAVQSALEVCKTKKRPVLIFQKGRYDFWPEHSVKKVYYESNTTAANPKNCAIWIEGFQSLNIDGGGADFIYHGRIQPFTIDNSRQVTIKNLQIDWEIPLTAQAVVTDTSGDFIDIRIDKQAYPYTIENDKLVFTGEDWKSRWWDCMEFDKDNHMIVAKTGDDGVLGNHWESYIATEQTSGIVRLKYVFARKPSIGNILVMRHSERDHAGMFITGSKDIVLENIYLHHTAGLGILSQYAENLHFSNIHVVPNKIKGRYFSGHDDGCHFSNCKGSILVENCSFAGLMDDPINVHGTAVQIIEKKSATELHCRFMHEQSIGTRWALPGDRIGFINHKNMQTIRYGTVASFEALDTVNFIITFKEALPDALGAKDALENITWTPDVTIRNSSFLINRARGILISTPGKVLIEGNRFESSGAAILIAGDANQWFESGAVKNVMIRKNGFMDNCLTSMYQFCEAIISIEPEIPQPESKAPFHRNISITQNNFYPYDYPVLYAKSVAGLTFTGNTITRSNRFKPFHHNRYMFSFTACEKVLIKNNQLKGDVLGKNILLKKMLTKDVVAEPVKAFTIQKQ